MEERRSGKLDLKYGKIRIRGAITKSTLVSLNSHVCAPVRDIPIFATIKINYVPDRKIVELKSLKLYLNSFRDIHVSHEEVTNRIYSELEKRLKPRFLEVIGDFNPRGNVKTIVRVCSEKAPKESGAAKKY